MGGIVSETNELLTLIEGGIVSGKVCGAFDGLFGRYVAESFLLNRSLPVAEALSLNSRILAVKLLYNSSFGDGDTPAEVACLSGSDRSGTCRSLSLPV
jgi:hypothetical protein